MSRAAHLLAIDQGTTSSRALGAGLTEAELRFLSRNEWARTGEDVLWRRTKLGLRLSAAERDAVDRAMAEAVAA